jgi:arginase
MRGGEGPSVIHRSPLLTALKAEGFNYQWDATIKPAHTAHSLRQDEKINQICTTLAKHIANDIRQKKPFSVIGGDHTSAIGTWSGAYDALHQQGEIGLIWVDAHMDSHTPETTLSGRLHGMPLASLLGYGYASLSTVLHDSPKLKPEHVCLVGVRSFESGESDLLKRLNVRIYFMDEVKSRGIEVVMQEAVTHVKRSTVGYGLSIDLDAFDPEQIPGVDVPVPGGIDPAAFCLSLGDIARDPALIGTELVEFNPAHDRHQKTEQWIATFIRILGSAT